MIQHLFGSFYGWLSPSREWYRSKTLCNINTSISSPWRHRIICFIQEPALNEFSKNKAMRLQRCPVGYIGKDLQKSTYWKTRKMYRHFIWSAFDKLFLISPLLCVWATVQYKQNPAICYSYKSNSAYRFFRKMHRKWTTKLHMAYLLWKCIKILLFFSLISVLHVDTTKKVENFIRFFCC